VCWPSQSMSMSAFQKSAFFRPQCMDTAVGGTQAVNRVANLPVDACAQAVVSAISCNRRGGGRLFRSSETSGSGGVCLGIGAKGYWVRASRD